MSHAEKSVLAIAQDVIFSQSQLAKTLGAIACEPVRHFFPAVGKVKSAKTLGAIAFEPTQDFLEHLEYHHAKNSDQILQLGKCWGDKQECEIPLNQLLLATGE